MKNFYNMKLIENIISYQQIGGWNLYQNLNQQCFYAEKVINLNYKIIAKPIQFNTDIFLESNCKTFSKSI